MSGSTHGSTFTSTVSIGWTASAWVPAAGIARAAAGLAARRCALKDEARPAQQHTSKALSVASLHVVAAEGEAKKASFTVAKPDTDPEMVPVEFDMIHVCPPQSAPDLLRVSPSTGAADASTDAVSTDAMGTAAAGVGGQKAQG